MRILAFDVSETLQTGAPHNDGGKGQPMMFENEVIPDAYSILNGGDETAQLLKAAQEADIRLVLVTNNGGEARARTLDFLQRYGVTIHEDDYYEPPITDDGMASKVDRLDLICEKYGIAKEQICFFDDSRVNVEEAQAAGYSTVRVKTPHDLQNGIRQALEQKAEAAPASAALEVSASVSAQATIGDAAPAANVSAHTSPVTAEEERHVTAAVAVAEIDLEREDNHWLQQRQWLTAQQHVESAEAALAACQAVYGERWVLNSYGIMAINLQLFGQPREHMVFNQSVCSEFLPNLHIGSLAAMVGHYDEEVGPGCLPKYELIIDLSQEIQSKSSDRWIPSLDAARHVTINVGDTGDNFDEIVENLTQQLPRIQETRQRGGQVLINCAQGQSRSATAAALYLMLSYNIGAVEAVKYLQAHRHQVAPNPGYMAALIAYEKKHLRDVKPFDKAIAQAFAEDFLNRYDVGTATSAFTGVHQGQRTTLAFHEEGETVVISADKHLAAQSCIDLLGLLKYLDIPFVWSVYAKHEASIQISADDFNKLTQCLRTKTLHDVASANAAEERGASIATVPPAPAEEIFDEAAAADSTEELAEVEFAAATTEVGSASEEEVLPVFAAQYRTTDANIFRKPTEITPAAPNAQIVIGDLHGNFMKFLYFLVRHQVIDISDEGYNRLCEIYRKPVEELAAGDIGEFNGLLEALPIKQRPLVRLIGDELADRGQNDYFMLKLLQKLHQGNVRVEVNLSNHSIEFSQACANYQAKRELAPPVLEDLYAMSLINLQHLLKNGLVSWDEVKAINETIYQPMLRIIGYSLDTTSQPTSITLYSHAGMDFQAIEGLCHKFGVVLDASSAEALGQTLDAINANVQQCLVKGKLEELVVSAVLGQGYREVKINPSTYPVEYLLWNRTYSDLRRANGNVEHGHGKGYDIRFVHGHDSTDATQVNIYNLDNILGKTLRAYWNPQVIQRDIYEAEHTEFVCAETTPVLSVTAQAAAVSVVEAVAPASDQPQPAASVSTQGTTSDAALAVISAKGDEPRPVTEPIEEDSLSDEVSAQVRVATAAQQPEAEESATPEVGATSPAAEGRYGMTYNVRFLSGPFQRIEFNGCVLSESMKGFNERFQAILAQIVPPDHAAHLIFCGRKFSDINESVYCLSRENHFMLAGRFEIKEAAMAALRLAAKGEELTEEAIAAAQAEAQAVHASATASPVVSAAAASEVEAVSNSETPLSTSAQTALQHSEGVAVKAPVSAAETARAVVSAANANTMRLDMHETADLVKQGQNKPLVFKFVPFADEEVIIADYEPGILAESLASFEQRFQAILRQSGQPGSAILWVESHAFGSVSQPVKTLAEIIQGCVNAPRICCNEGMNKTIAIAALREAATGVTPAVGADMGASLTPADAAVISKLAVDNAAVASAEITPSLDDEAAAAVSAASPLEAGDGNSALSLETDESELHTSAASDDNTADSAHETASHLSTPEAAVGREETVAVSPARAPGTASPVVSAADAAASSEPTQTAVDTGVFAGAVGEGTAYGVTTKPSLSNHLLVGVGVGLMCGGLAAVTVLTFGAALLPALILGLGSSGAIVSGAVLGATLGAGLGYLAHKQGLFAKPAHIVAEERDEDLLLQPQTTVDNSSGRG